METVAERRSKFMRYLFSLLSMSIPIFMLTRPFHRKASRRSKEELLLGKSKVDFQGAIKTAQEYIPGTPVEIELEEEHGTPVWEISIVPEKGGPAREIVIDARSGKLMEMKAKYHKEEGK